MITKIAVMSTFFMVACSYAMEKKPMYMAEELKKTQKMCQKLSNDYHDCLNKNEVGALQGSRFSNLGACEKIGWELITCAMKLTVLESNAKAIKQLSQ